MVWNMNFCAPFVPNDQTINFHRLVQTSEVLFLLVAYLVAHVYYKFIKKTAKAPLTQRKTKQQIYIYKGNNSQEKSSNASQPQNQSQNEQSDHQKSVSISVDKESVGENDSRISFKSTDFRTRDDSRKSNKQTKQIQKNIQETQMSLQQLQNFFPIVIGHHLVAMGASIMYSPYAEQSIACLLYSVLILLVFTFNVKRLTKTTYVFWGFMCLVNIFLLMSAVIEIGQSNYDFIKQKCFSQEYVSIY